MFPDSAQGLRNVRVKIIEPGPLVASLLIEAEAPGCRRFQTEYRIISGLRRLDIVNRMDKTAVRSKEGVHFAFPFSAPNGRIRYDVASGIVEPERDQLAGSCKNFFSVESWVDFSGDTGGVTLITPDAPLVEIGAITAEAPWRKRVEPSGTFYSYVMNNYWHTNYKADQEGPVEFRYTIIPHGAFRAEEVLRRGREGRRPLLAAVTDPSIPLSAPMVFINSETVIVESIRPLPGGKSWLLYAYNPSERPCEFRLEWGRLGRTTIMISDICGMAGRRVDGVVTLPPYGSRFIRVDGAE
jgi:alpha-mannosidase